MEIINALQAADAPNPHGVSARNLFSSEHAQVTMVTLQPGETLKLHITPVDVFFYILEGTGIVLIGDEEREVVKDMLINSPARIPHLLRNPHDDVFRFLVVKTPRPTSRTTVL